MEITKIVKLFIRRGANTFGNIVYTIFLSISHTPTLWFAVNK